jgi:hypothetical protein
LAPVAELVIDGQSYLDGAEDRIEIHIIDEDDPHIDYSIETSVDWPGAGFQMLEGDFITAPSDLESGEAFITTRITSGIWTDLEWSWTRPVFLTPPQISTPTLCENDMLVDTINRGTEGADIWVGVTDGRPLQNAGIRLGPSGAPSNSFSSIFFELGIPPASCAPGTGQDTHYYRMSLNPDYLLTWPLGDVELEVNLRDIDGISGLSQTLTFELQGSEPILDFSAMPSEFISGNLTQLIVSISDPDGIQNMECSILLKDEDEITLFSQIYHPDEDGLWMQEWTPPGKEVANHTLYFACIDETSLSVSESVLLRAREATTVPVSEENTTQQGKDEMSPTMILTGFSIALLLLIAITVLLIGRREEIVIEEDEAFSDDVWAKRDEDTSNEILTEMAGIQVSESQEWNDADLLEAGWTQEQIDVYRLEKNSQEIEDHNHEEE